MSYEPDVRGGDLIRWCSETERNWDLDLAEDVKGEVESKYGKLKRIKVEKMSAVSENLLLISGLGLY